MNHQTGTSGIHCRICSSKLSMPKLTLPKMPLTDDFVSVAQSDREEFLADIAIYQCDACGLVQNPIDFDHEGYYKDYAYTSGHSAFVQRFMAGYATALLRIYQELHGRSASSVIEAGSGDGEQLWQFKELGVSSLCGVEPSTSLTDIANKRGVKTELGFFDSSYAQHNSQRYDICLSSYTFDHVRDPRDYLRAACELLTDGGLLSFEVHDLDVISHRSEFCLFEHEHTIYLNSQQARKLLLECGFEVVAINPVAADAVRGNSLIVVAKKLPKTNQAQSLPHRAADMDGTQRRIQALILRLNEWVAGLPIDERLVGFGVGGRGVMTLAALQQPSRFSAMFDSNYTSNQLLTPKTRIPVVGPKQWSDYCDAHCLVYSFGYFQEIRQQLLNVGFNSQRIVSLADFFETESAA
jgi:predicted TPR repeat methyltransferase